MSAVTGIGRRIQEVPGLEDRPEPPHPLRSHRSVHRSKDSGELPLSERADLSGIREVGRAEEIRVSAGTMRREITRLCDTIRALPAPDRGTRVALWALEGELRKLERLDDYVSGLIRA